MFNWAPRCQKLWGCRRKKSTNFNSDTGYQCMINFMLRRYYLCLSSPSQWQHCKLNGPKGRAGGGGEKLFFTRQELRGISEVFQSVVTTLAELPALLHSIISHWPVQKCCYSRSTLNTASQWCTVSQYRDTVDFHTETSEDNCAML
jgi:hypothetical protein